MEVPLERITSDRSWAGTGLTHPRPDRISILSIDVDAFCDRESDAICEDVGGAPRLLLGKESRHTLTFLVVRVVELIAWVSDDLQTIGLVVGIDLN